MPSSHSPSRSLLKIPDFEKKVQARLDDLLKSMMDLALGHFVTVAKFNKLTGEVETRIYEQPPDYKALSFLIENVIGKVPNRVELTGEGGGPVKVVPYMSMQEAMRLGIIKQALIEQAEADEAEDDEDDEDDVIEGEIVAVSDG